jgi:hypothetical protein
VRAVLALLFYRQVRSERGDEVDALLARYAAVDDAIAQALRSDLSGDGELVPKARAVLNRVVEQLAHDPAMLSELRSIQRTLVKMPGAGSERS